MADADLPPDDDAGFDPSRGTDLDGARLLGTTTHPGGDRLAESLARIGVLLNADRVELYRHHGDVTHLAGWWRTMGAAGSPSPDLEQPIERAWFPWGLGHVRPERFVMVQTVESLLVAPDGSALVGDDGTTACLHLPLRVTADAEPVGAICGYWVRPPRGEPRHLDLAAELGREALLDCEA